MQEPTNCACVRICHDSVRKHESIVFQFQSICAAVSSMARARRKDAGVPRLGIRRWLLQNDPSRKKKRPSRSPCCCLSRACWWCEAKRGAQRGLGSGTVATTAMPSITQGTELAKNDSLRSLLS